MLVLPAPKRSTFGSMSPPPPPPPKPVMPPSPKPVMPPPMMMAQSLSPMMPQAKLNAKSPPPKPIASTNPPMSRGSTIPPSPMMMSNTEASSEIQGWDDEYFHEPSEYPEMAPKLAEPMTKSNAPLMEAEPSTSQPNMSLIDKLGGFDIQQKINIRNIIRDEISNITGVNPLGIISNSE